MNFLEAAPDLSKEWDYCRNWVEHKENPSHPFSPKDISKSSKINVWWICKNGHRFMATPGHRFIGSKCPICVAIKNGSLLEKYPELCKEWDAKKNLEEHIKDEKWPAIPSKVSCYSAKSVWWKCHICGTSWKYRIGHRTKNKNIKCPICFPKVKTINSHGSNKLEEGINDLGTLYPEISKIWDYNKNKEEHDINNLFPENIHRILPNTRLYKIWWKCDKCNASWRDYPASIVKRINTRTSVCPKCSKISSFKYGTVSLFSQAIDWNWDKNTDAVNKDDMYLSGLHPSFTSASSSKSVWWKCHICGYEWKNTPRNICIKNQSCPSCSKIKNGSISKDLFLMSEWDFDKNKINPSLVSLNSTEKRWWICSQCGYKWEATPNSRNNKQRKRGCPKCAKFAISHGFSLLENNIYKYITERYPNLKIERRNRKILNGKELDIFIQSLNIAIEINGDYWHNDFDGTNKQEDKNKYKIDTCKSKGIKLAIIWESDWYIKNKEIIDAIDDLILNNNIRDILKKASTVKNISDKKKNDKIIKSIISNKE